MCAGEVLLSFYLQASVQSLQVATVSRMLYWRVLLNWRLQVSVEDRKSNLWTLGAFVHPHKNLWLMWTMRVIKVSEPWHRWRVPVRHRRADDSWVQVWSGSYANPVPSVSGPLEIHRGTACTEFKKKKDYPYVSMLCSVVKMCVHNFMHVYFRLKFIWMWITPVFTCKNKLFFTNSCMHASLHVNKWMAHVSLF